MRQRAIAVGCLGLVFSACHTSVEPVVSSTEPAAAVEGARVRVAGTVTADVGDPLDCDRLVIATPGERHLIESGTTFDLEVPESSVLTAKCMNGWGVTVSAPVPIGEGEVELVLPGIAERQPPPAGAVVVYVGARAMLWVMDAVVFVVDAWDL